MPVMKRLTDSAQRQKLPLGGVCVNRIGKVGSSFAETKAATIVVVRDLRSDSDI